MSKDGGLACALAFQPTAALRPNSLTSVSVILFPPGVTLQSSRSETTAIPERKRLMAAEIAEHRDPIEELETGAEILAFWHRKYGEKGFRELLTYAYSEPIPQKPWQLSSQERIQITTREYL